MNNKDQTNKDNNDLKHIKLLYETQMEAYEARPATKLDIKKALQEIRELKVMIKQLLNKEKNG